MIKSRKDIPEGDPNPYDNEVEGRELKGTADHHDSARQAELEAGNLDEGFLKRAGKSIKKTFAGQTTVGQIGAVLKDVILPFVPSGGVINRTTDRISGIFKSQQTEKPMLQKVLSIKNFINLKDENGNFSWGELGASVLQLVIAGAVVYGAQQLGIWEGLISLIQQ